MSTNWKNESVYREGFMQPNIAKEELGFCVCGLRVEIGEAVLMAQGKAVHVGCRKKAAQRDHEDQQLDLWRSTFLFDETQREALEHAEEVTGAESISFDGPTILAIDVPRLCGQVARVYE